MKDEWMVLAGGQPSEPDTLDDLASAKRPEDFWRALFARVANVDVQPSTTIEETEIPRDERITKGQSGSSAVGYRWTERVPLESSMFPTEVTDETFGLRGIDARWHYRLAQVGQAGRAGFRNGELRVRFDGEIDRAAFVDVWKQVFGHAPTFVPEG